MAVLLSAFGKGFGVSMGLIVAIGAQNAFVLRQGIQKQHRFITASICALIDIILIAMGVLGLGVVLQSHPMLLNITKWGGIVFLTIYGAQSFRAALEHQKMTHKAAQPSMSQKTLIRSLLALSLLNPHVYLDTVLLIGSIGTSYSDSARILYIIGASCASVVWFFALSYGASYLSPIFKKPKAWCILDALIGCVMWSIAISLIKL